jgi:hypothetical protein
MQLDHFFILTDKFAPEATLLTDLGLIEGPSNNHPGQGTANRRFFFSNTALELLYVRDEREADEGPARDLQFPARASNPAASPFGLVMRCDGDSGSPGFTGWRYQPKYFARGTSFLVAENSVLLDEPLCICMPENLPSGAPQARQQKPFYEVTELRIHTPGDEPSAVLRQIAEVDGIRIETGRPHLMEIAFGHEARQVRRDLRPGLPLILYW